MAIWEFKGRELANCNCDYGCNCQFGGLPDKENCQAIVAIQIDEGHHGDTKLDGLKVASVFHWPGPIHEGKGSCQAFVDESATPEQREAILRIMTGEDTDPMATVFAVFASTIENMYEPIFAPIDFEVDVEERTANLSIDGHVEMQGEPIKNPVTGDPVRARIHLPDGFEYVYADIGNGSSKSTGNVAIEQSNSYGQFAHLHLNSHGVVHA